MKNETKKDTIGARIKLAREALNLSQADLAKALGFQSATAISLIENGERGVSTKVLKELSSILHHGTQYFLTGKSEPTNLRIALRAEKDLSEEDKNAILRFINLAKNKSKKDGK